MNNEPKVDEHEETIFDVYNALADDRDTELTKEWTDSLNFLLIFASLLAGILTAFVVGSTTLLQPSSQDSAMDILMTISTQLSNNSIPAYTAPDFEVPVWAIVVNGLLFSALCTSLIAVFATVVSLQWVRSYAAGVNMADSRERARARHFRYTGMNKWRMSWIINSLPVILNFAVILFLAGLVEWMRNIHTVIYIICLTFTAILAVFYVGTTLSGIIWASCPYITPVSSIRGLLQFRLMFGWVLLKLLEGLLVTVGEAASFSNAKMLEGRAADMFRRGWSQWRRHLSEPGEVLNWVAENMEFSHGWSRRVKVALRAVEEKLSEGEIDGVWTRFLDGVCNRYLREETGFQLPVDSPKDVSIIKQAISCWQCPATTCDPGSIYQALQRYPWSWQPTMALFGPNLFIRTLTDDEKALVFKLAEWYHSKAPEQYTDVWEEIIGGKYSPQMELYAADRLSTFIMDYKRPAISDAQFKTWLKLLEMPIQSVDRRDGSDISASLSFSAVQALAFGRPVVQPYASFEKKDRLYWGSKQPIQTVDSLGDRYDKVIMAIRALCRRFSSQATSHESPPLQVAADLYYLSTLLAHTPASQGIPSMSKINEVTPSWLVVKADSILAGYEPTPCFLSTAISALVWLEKLEELEDIHHYLSVFLSIRRRHVLREPSTPPSGAIKMEQGPNSVLSTLLLPVWRNWPSKEAMELHASRAVLMEEWKDKDIDLLFEVKDAQRFTDVIMAFDRLITYQTRPESVHQITPEEHLVLVQLIVDDARDIGSEELDSYFSLGQVSKRSQ